MALQTVGVRLRSPPTYVLKDGIIEGQAMRLRMKLPLVVPAQAGTQRLHGASLGHWTPACAGVTARGIKKQGDLTERATLGFAFAHSNLRPPRAAISVEIAGGAGQFAHAAVAIAETVAIGILG